MLRERDEAESVLDGPNFDFSIITTCGNHGSIRRVGNRVEVEEVTLLLHDVGFTLPLPDEELSLFSATHGHPVGLSVDSNTVNFVLGNLKRVDRL